jgi:hypothetical protein
METRPNRQLYQPMHQPLRLALGWLDTKLVFAGYPFPFKQYKLQMKRKQKKKKKKKKKKRKAIAKIWFIYSLFKPVFKRFLFIFFTS